MNSDAIRYPGRILLPILFLLLNACTDVEEVGDSFSDNPRVLSAISLDNTSVVVSFSNAMGGSATDETNYVIVQESINPEVGYLGVISASFYKGDPRRVKLETTSQNEVTYRVTAVGVTDDEGNPMAPTEISAGVVVEPDSALFAGSPPDSNNFVDSDGDGLYDNEEQRGWTVTITRVSGEQTSREVSSNPNLTDTDGDGLDDGLELALHTDPRDPDTDDDRLGDTYERRAALTSPTRQDTDGDGLSDSAEINFFRTSPLQTDTDGDQLPDSEEVVLASRNARVADLPQPSIEIISTDLQLDVRFEETDQSGTRDLESRQVGTTLTQGDEKTSSRTRSTSNEITAKVSVGHSVSSPEKVGALPKYSTSIGVEAGTTADWSSSWSEESTRSSQDEYNRSLSTEVEVSEESTVTRRVDGASMKAAVMLGSLGDIAFNISNIQITALVPDIRNPGVYLPVATLVPEVPEDSDLENSYTLGPLVGERGPIIFTNRDVFPAQVERLMKDPTGVIFKISNYNISDELGRDFAFTSQDIIDRTTLLSIDFGTRDTDNDGIGDGSELYRVATSLGIRAGEIIDRIALSQGKTGAEVRAEYGIDAADDDSLIAYDPDGEAVGVAFHDIMQNILGFTRYDEDVTPTTMLSSTEQGRSYSTRVDKGIEQVVRIRQTCNNDLTTCGDNPGVFRRWATLTPSGLLVGGELSFGDSEDPRPNDDFLLPGKAITLAYVQDVDLDTVPARLEVMHGCDDNNADTDNDGLNDRLEVFGAAKDENGFYINPADKWEVNLAGRGSYEGFSGCNALDSDNDGLFDRDEYYGTLFLQPEPDSNLTRTDTSHTVNSLPLEEYDIDDAGDPSNYRVVALDTGEVIPVTAVTTFPTFSGAAELVNLQAVLAHELVDSTRQTQVFVSRLNFWWKEDEDEDGKFFPLGRLDAKNSDTDGDGIGDYEELTGYTVNLFFGPDPDSRCTDDPAAGAPVNQVICTSDPLNPDSDFDTLPDGGEVALRSDPSINDGDAVTDLDGDGLVGREESQGWPITVTWFGTDPCVSLNCNPLYVPTPEEITTTCFGPDIPGGDCRVHENKVVESDVTIRDTDGDGLDDRAERDNTTHPDDTDSDNDGRTDFEELAGYPLGETNPGLVVTSNPLHYDTDGDTVPDGEELEEYTVGPVTDENGNDLGTRQQTSDPNGEADTDLLNDYIEREIQHTDAALNDTDSDGVNDRNEIRLGSDPLRANQVCVTARFKSVTLVGQQNCDGAGADSGAEVFGRLFTKGKDSSGEEIVFNPWQEIDKQLFLNSTESLPPPGTPGYALLEVNNPITFYTQAVRECDGAAENKGDGQIFSNCGDLVGYFTSVEQQITFEDYLDRQFEVKTPQAIQTDGGVQCQLVFDVEIIPMTDSLATTSDPGNNDFCGGDLDF